MTPAKSRVPSPPPFNAISKQKVFTKKFSSLPRGIHQQGQEEKLRQSRENSLEKSHRCHFRWTEKVMTVGIYHYIMQRCLANNTCYPSIHPHRKRLFIYSFINYYYFHSMHYNYLLQLFNVTMYYSHT